MPHLRSESSSGAPSGDTEEFEAIKEPIAAEPPVPASPALDDTQDIASAAPPEPDAPPAPAEPAPSPKPADDEPGPDSPVTPEPADDEPPTPMPTPPRVLKERSAAPIVWTEPVIVLESVSKVSGAHTLLKDVSLRIYPGDVLALIGPLGGGQAMAGDILSGHRPPSSGRVILLGKQRGVGALAFHTEVATAPRTTIVDPELTVRENLDAGSRRAGRPSADADQLASTQLSRFDLDGLADVPAGALSAGQIQLLAIARAAAGAPRLLVLNEPTVGLDQDQVSTVERAVAELAAEGTAIALIAANSTEASAMGTTIVVLNGSVLASGTENGLVAANAPGRFLTLTAPRRDHVAQLAQALAGLGLGEIRADVPRRTVSARVDEGAGPLSGIVARLEQADVEIMALSSHPATLDDVVHALAASQRA